LAFIFLERFFC